VRDLSPDAERERLHNAAIDVVSWRDGEPEADVLESLDELAQCVADVYPHIDFDGFAPTVAPGIVDEPIPGGLSLEQGGDDSARYRQSGSGSGPSPSPPSRRRATRRRRRCALGFG
jgi:arginase family enzyme